LYGETFSRQGIKPETILNGLVESAGHFMNSLRVEKNFFSRTQPLPPRDIILIATIKFHRFTATVNPRYNDPVDKNT
jgi:hypothetical protein